MFSLVFCKKKHELITLHYITLYWNLWTSNPFYCGCAVGSRITTPWAVLLYFSCLTTRAPILTNAPLINYDIWVFIVEMYIMYFTRMSGKIFFQGVSCETLIPLRRAVNTCGFKSVVKKSIAKEKGNENSFVRVQFRYTP